MQKRWAKLLYQILSICQGKRGRGPPGRFYAHCAYNQSSALPADKKKYILLDNSSLEQWKELRFREGRTSLPGRWGSVGNPVFPLRPHRCSNLARA